MKIAGEYTFEASLPIVWDALFDAEVLARTLPGCDKLEREGDRFDGVLRVKMGPVQGKFQGKVDLSEVREHQDYRMAIDGRGPAGFAKASAFIELAESGATTLMKYDADIQIGGRIASVGQRLIDASIKAITKQSLESLHNQLKALQQAATAESELPTESESRTEAEGAEPAVPEAPAAARSDVVSQPVAPQGPSQAAFALGVAREVSRDLFPAKKIILVAAVLVLAVAVYQVLS